MPRLAFDQSDGELWFVPCRFDGTLEASRDPFTGQPVQIPRNGALTPAEERAVDAALGRARSPAYDNVVQVSDGAVAEIERAPSSLMLKPRFSRPTLGLARLVHDVLAAGSWCLRSDEALVATSAEHARDLPKVDARVPAGWYEQFPREVVVVASAEALAAALGWDAS